MNKERLLRLADFLEKKVPERDFDMSNWFCDTTACAAGWATVIPEFVKAGFKAKVDESTERTVNVSFDDKFGFSACEAFFDLTEGEATSIFSPSRYPTVLVTKQQVANRIRKLVSSHV